MNTLVIRVTAVVCVVAWHAVSLAQSGKPGGPDTRSIQPGDLGKTDIAVSSKDGPLLVAKKLAPHIAGMIQLGEAKH